MPVKRYVRQGTIRRGYDGLPDLPVTTTLPAPTAGALPIGTSSYAVPFPIPSTYRFVDPAAGNDSTGAGTIGAPWQSWNKAQATAPDGATIVIRAGVLHETLAVPSTKTFTIQAAVGEVVWFDGSSVLTGWSSSGGVWSAAYGPSYSRAASPYGTWAAGTPEGDYRAYADQMWIDGSPLVQIADNATPAVGQFSVQTGGTVKIGTNPSGKEVRAADLGGVVIASTITLRGIGFRRYSPKTISNSGADGWAVLYFATNSYNSVVENCVFDYPGYVAVSSIRPITLRWLTITNTMMTPINLEKGDGSVLEGIRIEKFNLGRFNAEPQTAAVKVGRTNGLVIRDFYIREGPGAYGIWLDVNCSDYAITGNDIDGYTGLCVTLGNDMERGIEVEISGGGLFGTTQKKGIIAGNRVRGCEVGVMVFNSDWNLIYNNDLRGNDVCMMFWQDTRASRDTYRSTTEVPWLTQNNHAHNNILGLGGFTVAYKAMIECEDQRSSHLAGSTMFPDTCSGNWFELAGNVASLNNAGSTARTSYASLATLASAVGSKLGSNTEQSTAPAATTAIGVPAEVAAALGVPTGSQAVGPFAPAPIPR